MVRLTTRTAPGPVLLIFGLLAGVASVALGVGLLGDVESGFGAVWALGFVILGLIVLGSGVAIQPRWSRSTPPVRETTWSTEPARFYPRRSGLPTATAFLTTGLLGAWFVAIGVVGALERSWLWLVLAALPAAYFSGFTVLWLIGRFRPTGVWLTPTRVVDEHYGLRSELRLVDVAGLSPRTETLHLTPAEGVAVTQRALTPRPWRARGSATALVIQTRGLRGGTQDLAADVQRRVDAAGR